MLLCGVTRWRRPAASGDEDAAEVLLESIRPAVLRLKVLRSLRRMQVTDTAPWVGCSGGAGAGGTGGTSGAGGAAGAAGAGGAGAGEA